MSFKDYLMSLNWNTFAKYPAQGSDIYIHCFTDDGAIHKFVKVTQFNAVCFDYQKIVNQSFDKHLWRFAWLPATTTEENYDTSASH